jgi:energy-coupling factor transporter ATP-binding protein EcfA2
MARAFRRSGRGAERRYVATLDADEREVVASLMDQVHDLLEPPDRPVTGDTVFDDLVAGLDLGSTEGAGAAEVEGLADRDPALERLLPSANREDDAAATEFRRLTEGGLRHRKALALAASAAVLRLDTETVALDADQARSFLTALTDVRLVLGERLGLRADEDLERLEQAASSLGPEEPLLHALALYDFLTWLQETLAGALLRG